MPDLTNDAVFAPGTPTAQTAPAVPAPARPQEFTVDASEQSTAYANFVRLTGTPEELVLDWGLNLNMTPQAGEAVKLTHRLVVDYFTAKRLLGALHSAVQQHENVYGMLEVDVNKRRR